MIRERRNKDKLASYYRKFMEEGIVDPNVHPWVADSWQRCRAMHLPHETMPKINKLSREEIIAHQKTHEFIVKYVDGLYEQSKQHFNIHNLSMLLIDENGYVIKNFYAVLPTHYRGYSGYARAGGGCWYLQHQHCTRA